MTSQCVESNYANGFLRLITGAPRCLLSGISPEDPERLLGWSGSRSVQWSGRRVPWKPAGWWGPSPAPGSLERAGCELCCGRVKQEGGWATRYLWLHRGCPIPRGLSLGAFLAGLWLGVARQDVSPFQFPSDFPLVLPAGHRRARGGLRAAVPLLAPPPPSRLAYSQLGCEQEISLQGFCK